MLAKPISASPAPNNLPPRARELPVPIQDPPGAELFSTIRTLGGLLDDLERVRVANGLRIGAMEREYGEALPHLDVIQKQLRVAEHLAELELVRAWRKHPLAPWAKEFHGVGEKSIARLIAVIGDPGERANVAKLWAYCGHGDPARKRTKGMSQEEAFRLGNPAAKKRVWLIATSLLKAGNRDIYDARRAATSLTHPDWTAGHSHADALRIVGKEFLGELWIASHFATNTKKAGTSRKGAPTFSTQRG